MSWPNSFDLAVLVPAALRRRPIRSIYLGEAVKAFAVGLFSIFEPIYLYTIFRDNGFPHPAAFVFLYYGALYVPFAFCAFLAARLIPRFGFRMLSLLSTLFLFAYFLLLIAARRDPSLLIVAIAMLIIRFAAFWPAYHLFFARMSISGKRGEELSNLAVFTAVMGAVSPAIGGLIAAHFGFPALIATVLLGLLLSTIPYLVADLREGHRGSFFQPITEGLRNAGGSGAMVAFVAQGIEDSASAIAWPLLLFLIALSFQKLGVFTMVATALGFLTTFLIGHLADRSTLRFLLLLVGAPLVAIFWLFRAATFSIPMAFFANTAVGLTRPFVTIPFSAIFYDRVSSVPEHRQMHLILFREFFLNAVGRGLFFFGGAAVLWFGGSIRLLLLAAVPATIAMVLLLLWIPPRSLAHPRANEEKEEKVRRHS